MSKNQAINASTSDDNDPAVDSQQAQKVLETISSEVTTAVNQLPNSAQLDYLGIKELLAQLHRRIEGNHDLSSLEKANALLKVKALAEAGRNPQVEEKRIQAETAITALRRMCDSSHKVPNFIEACNELLPQIAGIFGIEGNPLSPL